MKLIVFGATGLAGHGALSAALDAPEVREVLVVARRSSGRTSPKLREILHQDFEDFSSIEVEFSDAHACLWCLGVSASAVSEEDYRRITFGYPLAAARSLRRVAPSLTFVYVSGMGAGPEARAGWARVKAEAEQALLGLGRCYAVRPAAIFPVEGARSTDRNYRLAHAVLGPLLPLWKLILRDQVITTRELGEAMLTLVRAQPAAGGPPPGVLENRELLRLLSGGGGG